MGVLDIYSLSTKTRERKALSEKAVVLYRSAREKYLGLPERCLELREALEERGLAHRIPEQAFRSYKSYIELFSFDSEESVSSYCQHENLGILNVTIKEAKEALDSWEYKTLRDWAADAAYRVKRHDAVKQRQATDEAFRKDRLNSLPAWLENAQ